MLIIGNGIMNRVTYYMTSLANLISSLDGIHIMIMKIKEAVL